MEMIYLTNYRGVRRMGNREVVGDLVGVLRARG